MAKKSRNEQRLRRHLRVRAKISGTDERPRLNIFRSLNQIYAQLIDDQSGRTLASASSLEQEIRRESKETKTEQARAVGELIARRAKEHGISQVIFDRGGFRYHGRVKALAEGARKGGLEF